MTQSLPAKRLPKFDIAVNFGNRRKIKLLVENSQALEHAYLKWMEETGATFVQQVCQQISRALTSNSRSFSVDEWQHLNALTSGKIAEWFDKITTIRRLDDQIAQLMVQAKSAAQAYNQTNPPWFKALNTAQQAARDTRDKAQANLHSQEKLRASIQIELEQLARQILPPLVQHAESLVQYSSFRNIGPLITLHSDAHTNKWNEYSANQRATLKQALDPLKALWSAYE